MGTHLGKDSDIASSDFEALALPHLDAAYNLARWLTGDDHAARDLVQDAYLRAFRFADSFRGGDARAWLLTIVRHTFYSALRDGKQRSQDVSYDEALHDGAAERPGDGDPAALLASRDSARALNAALAQLPPALREVLIMKEMDELSYKQIALVTDVPIGTVMSRLARARKALLERLQSARMGG